uniref:Putative group iii salivary lipocalin n=1 Tax=Rhipicephalus pulchellus TaxID=72859 RepID=L7M9F4_RHIPC
MLAFTALTLWTFSASLVTASIYNPFDVLKMNLSEYQNPWPVINNTNDVYLSRVSEENVTLQCVKSRYWGYEEKNGTVYRSFNFSTLNTSSSNISINVKYEKSQNESNTTMLEVISMDESGIVFPNGTYSLRNRTFPVLYSDINCLILGDALNATRFTNCSLWFPFKNRYSRLNPPTCCEFLFAVLCGRGTKFDWVNKCRPYE